MTATSTTKQDSTIYVVDDEEPIRSAFEVLLRGRGIDVRTFSSAECFLRSYADDWTGLLLVDSQMPEMDGTQLCLELKRRNCSLRIVLMTGHEGCDSLKEALGDEVRLLEKPFKVQEIVNGLFASALSAKDEV